MRTLLWFRRDLRLSDHPALAAAADDDDDAEVLACFVLDPQREASSELSSVDDAHLSKGERPDAYPAPIVDHAAERAEALRRYHSI
jgi:deoxyribodipyrimidine photolyase